MLKKIIDNYIELNKIKKYCLIDEVWTMSEWESDNVLSLSNDIIFVYDFNSLVNIDVVTDFLKGFIVLRSPKKFIDYKQLVIARNIGEAIQLSSSFISIHNTSLTFEIATSKLYSTMYSGHIKFIRLRNVN
ncbi:MAG: hypothetical protein KAT68_00680 [Bacteroidales bacterium]|nr:hypothetical protein [Bacteroidales bacterium]